MMKTNDGTLPAQRRRDDESYACTGGATMGMPMWSRVSIEVSMARNW